MVLRGDGFLSFCHLTLSIIAICIQHDDVLYRSGIEDVVLASGEFQQKVRVISGC